MALRLFTNPFARATSLARSRAPRATSAYCSSTSSPAPNSSGSKSSSNERSASVASHRVVFSLMGKDRVGIVKDFTSLVRQYGGNVEGSRMVQLGGEFAMIVCVRLGGGRKGLMDAIDGGFEGFTVGFRDVVEVKDSKKNGGLWYMELEGPDAEGIVAAVTEALAVHGGSVKEMDTDTVTAPFAGFQLFKMEGRIRLHDGNLDSITRSFRNIEERFGCSIIFKQAEEA
eukprot:Plantae.Rhodophyta-Hildenbrandia_rubra.ctg7451.p1 GENE.Plantae.Rhodophyta-Hildenbrandia_rubra.ctg7451~~Plantae.Rhodophyta-Hildenbrandia_rubra.ctg7451.p1  ORF type:complete len:228 (+),score=41.14 Plantae.Rhodophyta-Hildenbrandia_rubra.ctg7451:301-984(+)